MLFFCLYYSWASMALAFIGGQIYLVYESWHPNGVAVVFPLLREVRSSTWNRRRIHQEVRSTSQLYSPKIVDTFRSLNVKPIGFHWWCSLTPHQGRRSKHDRVRQDITGTPVCGQWEQVRRRTIRGTNHHLWLSDVYVSARTYAYQGNPASSQYALTVGYTSRSYCHAPNTS